MKIYRGIPVSPGIVISRGMKYRRLSVLELVKDECTVSDPDIEVFNLNKALEKAIQKLNSTKFYTQKDIVDVLELMLRSIVDEAINLIKEYNLCASLAIKEIYEKYSMSLRNSTSQLFALREEDIRAISELLIETLISRETEIAQYVNRVIICDEISITEFLESIKQGVKGLVTKKGGINSHVAIVARSSNIPYVIVPALNLDDLSQNPYIVIDGLNGLVIIDPGDDDLKRYIDIAENYQKTISEISIYARERALTTDGYLVEVLCNVGDLEEARIASTTGCEGIGLFRVEFLYMQHELPSVNKLHESFSKVAEFFSNKPVVIRAPDIGGDKPIPYLASQVREDNPFMGLRGVRLLLEYRNEVFKPFIKAFLSAYRKHSNLQLLLPMVSRVSEIDESIELIHELGRELSVDVSNLRIGIMVEVPSIALLVDKVSESGNVKFVSFGTNDLTQYILAVDRANPRVSYIYDDLDTSVLRILKTSMETASRLGLKVEVCGELASNQLAVPILLSFNTSALSVNRTMIGVIKYTISRIHLEEFKNNILPSILSTRNGSEVRELVKSYMLSKDIKLLSSY